MGSENGRSLADDKARYAAGERRELTRGDEQAADDGRQRDAAVAQLERLKPQLAEAHLQGTQPPQAARALQQALAQAVSRIEAWKTLRPEKVRALNEREAEWLAKRAPEIQKQSEERLAEVAAAFLTAADVLAGYEEYRTDVVAAAPSLAPPQLPNLRAKLDLLFDTIAGWPPAPAAPSALIAVRLSAKPPKALDPLHRLYSPVTAARVQLVLERYGPADVFGVPPRLTVDRTEYGTEELLEYLGLERVADDTLGRGATP
jgi:hypothetical protein